MADKYCYAEESKSTYCTGSSPFGATRGAVCLDSWAVDLATPQPTNNYMLTCMFHWLAPNTAFIATAEMLLLFWCVWLLPWCSNLTVLLDEWRVELEGEISHIISPDILTRREQYTRPCVSQHLNELKCLVLVTADCHESLSNQSEVWCRLIGHVPQASPSWSGGHHTAHPWLWFMVSEELGGARSQQELVEGWIWLS